jgi:hypothetical protein
MENSANHLMKLFEKIGEIHAPGNWAANMPSGQLFMPPILGRPIFIQRTDSGQ